MRTILGATLALAGTGALSVAAEAQTAADEGSARNTITVTATLKAEPEALADVPIAITALDAEDLANRKVRALSDLSFAAPGVSLDQVGTFRGVANWSIRGLGINSSIASIDPAVGTFVDGVYLGINPGASLDLFDLQQVEILRGPQGTLFGRNVTGGAVLLETANPTDEFHFGLRLSGEGPVDGHRGAMAMTASGYVSGPLSDRVSVRLAGYHNDDGGWFRNLATGGNLGKAETNALRGTVLYEDGPLRVLAKTEYLDTEGDGAVTQNHGLFPRDGFQVSLDNPGFIKARVRSASLRIDHDLGAGKLTSITGWRKFWQYTSNDIDSSPAFIFHSNTGLRQQQWSEELRWAGDLTDTVELTMGGYWFHQKMGYDEDRRIPPFPLFYGGGRQKQDALGLFAQTDWQLAPALTLTAGLRWTQEDKAANVTFVRIRPYCSAIGGSCPVTGTNPSIPGEPNGFSDKHDWSNLSPKLGLSWQASDGVLAYADWSRAYRSGGYNLRITQPAAFLANAAAAGTPAFGAERVDSFEGGIKFATADGTASLNLAAYHTRVKGMQREVSQSDGGSGLAQSIYNTADARIWGGEVEGQVTLGQIELSANAGYVDAKYKRAFYDISGDGAVNAADLALRLPRVPKWTWGFGLEHRLPLGEVSALVTSVRFQHRDRYAYTDNNFGWVGALDNLDADVTWQLPVAGWSLSIYGRNLLDEVQFGGDTQLPWPGPLSDGNNRPFDPRPAAGTFSPLVKGRTMGLELAIEF